MGQLKRKSIFTLTSTAVTVLYLATENVTRLTCVNIVPRNCWGHTWLIGYIDYKQTIQQRAQMTFQWCFDIPRPGSANEPRATITGAGACEHWTKQALINNRTCPTRLGRRGFLPRGEWQGHTHRRRGSAEWDCAMKRRLPITGHVTRAAQSLVVGAGWGIRPGACETMIPMHHTTAMNGWTERRDGFRGWLESLWQCEYSRLNPPSEQFIEVDGTLCETVIDDPHWHRVGYVPTPRTRWGWFLHHLCHGLAMRYPVAKVLLYAACNTRPGDGSD
jgi:hypothetical protein